MTTETETPEIGSKVLEGIFQNIRKAAETNLKLQQEILQQWTQLWPMPAPQAAWLDHVRDFQKKWSDAMSDRVRKHRDVMNKQYQAVVESFDAALRVGEATNPEEYRRRSEQFCRRTLDCAREVSESQLREFQDSAAKWTELATKAGT
jgi:hypothetical protein